jgi:hypothetical protein
VSGQRPQGGSATVGLYWTEISESVGAYASVMTGTSSSSTIPL